MLLPAETQQFPSEETDEIIAASDVVVALGGDGTIMHTAKRAAGISALFWASTAAALALWPAWKLMNWESCPPLSKGSIRWSTGCSWMW